MYVHTIKVDSPLQEVKGVFFYEVAGAAGFFEDEPDLENIMKT
jgi:hypothetical protein